MGNLLAHGRLKVRILALGVASALSVACAFAGQRISACIPTPAVALAAGLWLTGRVSCLGPPTAIASVLSFSYVFHLVQGADNATRHQNSN
jgi:hypothetical protein